MDKSSLQSRKDRLMRHFKEIVKEINDEDDCIILYNGIRLAVSKKCANKGYRIKPGDYIINRETKELFLFIGIGRIHLGPPHLFPWVIREGKYQPTVIQDSYLAELFDEKYILA